MIPATNTEPISRSTSTCQPTKAPRAPANFQSPAPRLRRKTNGKSTSSPKPAPNREAFSPALPFAITFTKTPIRNPVTVSQFGMRRLRQSVHLAISANATANPSTTAFKPTPIRTVVVFFSPQSDGMNAKAQPPTTLDLNGGNGSCIAEPGQMPSQTAFCRGFSHSAIAKSMKQEKGFKVSRFREFQGP